MFFQSFVFEDQRFVIYSDFLQLFNKITPKSKFWSGLPFFWHFKGSVFQMFCFRGPAFCYLSWFYTKLQKIIHLVKSPFWPLWPTTWNFTKGLFSNVLFFWGPTFCQLFLFFFNIHNILVVFTKYFKLLKACTYLKYFDFNVSFLRTCVLSFFLIFPNYKRLKTRFKLQSWPFSPNTWNV